MSNKRVGLIVGRFQPLHEGHCRIINTMIQSCETAIVCLGSAQKSRELDNPWTVEERMTMLRNVYGAYSNKGEYLGCRIKIVPLVDLGASSARPEEWTDYVFEKLDKLDLPNPTDYFTGSVADGFWYKHCFRGDKSGVFNRTPEMERFKTPEGKIRNLHIIDRNVNPVPPATDIRMYLSLRTDDWKQWVPAVNHNLVEDTFPEEFKIKS